MTFLFSHDDVFPTGGRISGKVAFDNRMSPSRHAEELIAGRVRTSHREHWQDLQRVSRLTREQIAGEDAEGSSCTDGKQIHLLAALIATSWLEARALRKLGKTCRGHALLRR